jgi:DNA-binding winged helix-turn-helix (wHTH) protein
MSTLALEGRVATEFSGFIFDSARREITRETGEPVHLTPKAFDLLAFLIDEAPRVVHKSEIHERLWPGIFVTDSTLVGLVKELRRSLQDRDARSPIIRTSHGVGYAFCAEIGKSPAPRATHEHWLVGPAGRMSLREGETLIGRDPACAVWLDVAGVSRRHARIIVHFDRAEIEDLGSKNGTLLREEPVASRTLLHDQDKIRIGPVRVTYRFCVAGVSTETVTVKVLSRDRVDPSS